MDKAYIFDREHQLNSSAVMDTQMLQKYLECNLVNQSHKEQVNYRNGFPQMLPQMNFHQSMRLLNDCSLPIYKLRNFNSFLHYRNIKANYNNFLGCSGKSADTSWILNNPNSLIQIRDLESTWKVGDLNATSKVLNEETVKDTNLSCMPSTEAINDESQASNFEQKMPSVLGDIITINTANIDNLDSNDKPLIVESDKKSHLNRIFPVCSRTSAKVPCPIETDGRLVFNIRRYSKKNKKYVLLTKHRKVVTKCVHTNSEYYAKGMCKKCYHNKGERGKYAKVCGHTNLYHYALGLWKGWYLTKYHKERKSKAST